MSKRQMTAEDYVALMTGGKPGAFQRERYRHWPQPIRMQSNWERRLEEAIRDPMAMYREAGESSQEQYAYANVSPGNVHINVALSNLLVDLSRDRARKPLNTISPALTVDKLSNYFWKLEDYEAFRISNIDDDAFPAKKGAGEPAGMEMKSDTDTYQCKQYALKSDIPYLMAQNADFDIERRKSELVYHNLYWRKAKRTIALLSSTADMNNGASGGVWTASSTTNKYIQKAIQDAVQAINLATYSCLDPGNLWLLINPNVAKDIAQSPEMIELIRYQAGDRFLQGLSPFSNAPGYGVPAVLFGVNVMVCEFAFNSAKEGASDSAAYMLGNTVAVLINSEPPGLQTMNTITTFEFQPPTVMTFDIPWEHRRSLQVLNTYDIKVTAKNSGRIITGVRSS